MDEMHDDSKIEQSNTDQTPSASDAANIVVARQVYPDRLPLVLLPSRPVFPKMVTPLAIESPILAELVKDALDSQTRLLGLVLQQPQPEEGGGTPPEPHRFGTIAQILRTGRPEGGPMSVLLGGLDRFEIARVLTREPYLVAEVRYAYEPRTVPSDEIKAYSVAIINSIKELVQLNPLFKEELSMLLNQGNLDEPSRLADLAAFLTSAGGAELQGVLETLEIRERMQAVLQLLRKELDISKLQSKIRQQLDERISKQQREFFLREQLKAIKQELGLEKDDKEAEIQKFVERLGSRTPSEEAKARIDDEVEKLRLLEPSSPEFSLTRNYLDWLTVLPWGVRSDEHVEMKHVRAALNENHFGLDDVKERILEFVAAGLLKGGFGGSIICLAGPPGVGKTSIGRSVAKALNREFYRFSLGGMRDEAEIKGHRRTYIGAMPGKFVQALRVCKTDNPVIMLDEIDKIGASFRGDPASALLEALDPEQNRDFLDHYLDVRFDLSNVLFLCTANQLDTIPPPLLDRMEVMKLSGYILEEKLEIAQRFIVPREIAALGLTKDRLTIKRQAVAEMIDGYARDAGLRNLEQQIKKIVRKCAVRILEEQPRYIVIDKTDVASLLGKRVFVEERILANPVPGVVMGLAWTSLGGDTLTIEATKVRSERGGFKQTGQLGKVMVESSEIAYTHARASCALAPETQSFFDQHFIHLHVPAGATPKDGPSAGITMAVALYTLAHGRAVRASFAMTGELDLSGHVLPVGGIREKLIAAKRAKVKHVILPRANEPDYEALPPHVKKGITVHMVERFSEVIALAVDGRTKPAGSARRKR